MEAKEQVAAMLHRELIDWWNLEKSEDAKVKIVLPKFCVKIIGLLNLEKSKNARNENSVTESLWY